MRRVGEVLEPALPRRWRSVKTTSARGVRDFSKILEQVAAKAPLRRNCEPAEVADAAVFLASNLGRGVTGNILFVDGGFQIMG